jgi:spore germination cell wall hydrolase CwlJ-like protein
MNKRHVIVLAVLSVFGIAPNHIANAKPAKLLNTKLLPGKYLINTGTTVKHSKEEIECLAKNIYYEAGVENQVGRYAVAQVTLNRLRSGQWGNNICRVVYSPKQFSWTLIKKLPKPDAKLWKECLSIAKNSLNGIGVNGLNRSLFYHADYIKAPKWTNYQKVTTQIGRHIFYDTAHGWTVNLNA